MGLLWWFYWVSLGVPPRVYEISVGLLWDFYWVSMVALSNFIKISQGCLSDSYKSSIWFPRSFYGTSMKPLWNLYGVSMRFLSDFVGSVIGFPWHFSWIPKTFLWIPIGFAEKVHDISRFISMTFSRGYYRGSIGFLWDFLGAGPMGFPWYLPSIFLIFLWNYDDV